MTAGVTLVGELLVVDDHDPRRVGRTVDDRAAAAVERRAEREEEPDGTRAREDDLELRERLAGLEGRDHPQRATLVLIDLLEVEVDPPRCRVGHLELRDVNDHLAVLDGGPIAAGHARRGRDVGDCRCLERNLAIGHAAVRLVPEGQVEPGGTRAREDDLVGTLDRLDEPLLVLRELVDREARLGAGDRGLESNDIELHVDLTLRLLGLTSVSTKRRAPAYLQVYTALCSITGHIR